MKKIKINNNDSISNFNIKLILLEKYCTKTKILNLLNKMALSFLKF